MEYTITIAITNMLFAKHIITIPITNVLFNNIENQINSTLPHYYKKSTITKFVIVYF